MPWLEHSPLMPLLRSQAALFCVLLALTLTVLMSFGIADIRQGQGVLAPHSLGYAVIAQYAIASLCMLYIWCFGPNSNKLYDYRWVVVFALVSRVILIPVDPYISNDIDRYLFDGRMLFEGLDPYSLNHHAVEVQHLIEAWSPPSEHMAYTTIYPPLAISLFGLVSAFGPDWAPVLWKAFCSLAGMASVWVFATLLSKLGQLRHFSLFALSPLLILETGIGAHIDIFCVLFIGLALVSWREQAYIYCGVFIALGALSKFLPLVLMMPLVFAAPSIKKRVFLVLACSSTIVIFYLLFIGLGLNPLGSLFIFFEKWRFGTPLFHWMSVYLSEHAILQATSAMLLLGFLLVALYLLKKIDCLAKPEHSNIVIVAMQVVLALPLMLSPVVYPWYLMPIVALWCIRPSVSLAAWILIMPATYEVLGQYACCHTWYYAHWPLWLLGVSFVLGLSVDLAIFKYRKNNLVARHQRA